MSRQRIKLRTQRYELAANVSDVVDALSICESARRVDDKLVRQSIETTRPARVFWESPATLKLVLNYVARPNGSGKTRVEVRGVMHVAARDLVAGTALGLGWSGRKLARTSMRNAAEITIGEARGKLAGRSAFQQIMQSA